MASLIPCYEYDIFISYRQKDNKHDGWVTEFVSQLKGELESTFKEDVSIYFDENPSDGLLETHSVDKSLEGKLKCLIFIPVISQTYCDTKSYAWQHEFCAFNILAKEDPFGRDIRLNTGNVTSRILPVKIHDLDPDDKTLLENELGGVLRSIEFIYKSAGVNRPLRANEDHPQDNLNKTYYRDQINKVANAIKEIINALKNQNTIRKDSGRTPITTKSPARNSIIKVASLSAIGLVLIILGVIFLSGLFKSGRNLERSIAVLPFINESPVDSNKYFINGIMEEVLNNLQLIKDFRVLSRTSTDKFKGPDKPTIPKIAKELGVNYIVEGSGQKYGTMFRLRVQLIKAIGKEDHLWGKSFELDLKETADLFEIQSQISKAIASELKTVITPDEKELIEKIPTSDMTAYNLYLKAEDYLKDYISNHVLSSYQTSFNLYNAALEADSAFARAYTGLARLYYTRYYYETFFKENFLDTCLYFSDRALGIDDQLAEAYYLKGLYYIQNGDIKEALDNYDKALIVNPNYSLVYSERGFILTWIMHDFINGIQNYQKALNLIQGKERPEIIRSLARAYLDAGFVEKSRSLYEEAYTLDDQKVRYLGSIAWLEFSDGNFGEAIKLGRMASTIDSIFALDLFVYSLIPDNEEESLRYAKKLIEKNSKRGTLSLTQTHRIGYAFYKSGKLREADLYLNQEIKYCEEVIKLRRILTQRRAAHYDLAATYAFLGQTENAFKYLDEFGKLDFYQLWWLTLVKNDPMFDSIRSDERFRNLIREKEKKYNTEHERVKKWLEENNML